ncbi:MAG: hypothetical protein IKP67_03870, partial [Spirochaetales bacterium]|nr:hypothetical protein [Spirochaetales bacterium]
ANRLKGRDVNVVFTDKLIDLITQVGYDPDFGARPIKRAIQTYIENALSKEIIKGNITEKQTVTIDAVGEEVVITSK